MSFFKKIEKQLRPFGKYIEAAVSTTGIGAAAVQARRVAIAARAASSYGSQRMERANNWGSGSELLQSTGYGAPMSLRSNMASLPTIMRTGAAVIPGAGAVGGSITRAVAGSVARRVGRYAGGAATAVGVGAILYDAAGNPVGQRRRRRSKGITANQLKAFTRVTAILNKYCKTPPPRRPAKRSTKCR